MRPIIKGFVVLSVFTLYACAADSAGRKETVPDPVYLSVIEYSPDRGADPTADIGIAPDITVRFDSPVSKDGISSKITLRPKALLNVINVQIRSDTSDDVLKFSPVNNLTPAETYTVSIRSICAVSGKCLRQEYTFDFQISRLEITDTYPAQNTAVGVTPEIRITFKPAPVISGIASKISFIKTADSSAVSYDMSFDASSDSLYLKPVSALSAGENYRITFNGLCSSGGVCTASPYVLDFTASASGWGDWTEITQTAASPSHADAAAVSFLGKIWITGGVTGISGSNTKSNKVYSSNAALTEWAEVSPSGRIWSVRSGHAAAVFNSRLWITGGETTFFIPNSDIWYSSDGILWTETTRDSSDLSWDARYGHRMAEFNGKLWLSGGFDNTAYKADIWNSDDGIRWTPVNAVFDQSFDARAFHGFVSTDSKLWIIGGKGTGGYLNDVWSSADGIQWTRISTGAFGNGRSSFCTFVRNNMIYITGGTSSAILNETRKSGDGLNWVQASPQTVYTPRYASACTEHAGQVYLTGGRDAVSHFSGVFRIVSY